MKNRTIKLIFLSIILILFSLLIIDNFNIPCLFKKYLHISCPGCGLTRAFRCIIHLDLLEAFKYNIISIPLFISIIISIILIIIDIIYNTFMIEKLFTYISKYKIIIITIIIIVMIINNSKYLIINF